MFSLIFVIIQLESQLSLWQRKATQVLTAAVLIPQPLNGWLQCFSCFSQSFNGETREFSSPWFLLIMLAALPAELWTGHFPPVSTGEFGSTIRSQEHWLRGSMHNMRAASKKEASKCSSTEVFHYNSPSYWQVLGQEERQYSIFSTVSPAVRGMIQENVCIANVSEGDEKCRKAHALCRIVE